jgi:hypothetical protein
VRVPFLLTLGIVGVASWTTLTGPPVPDAANNFRIVVDQVDYTQDEASQFGIKATVTNTSRDRDFYANVGMGSTPRSNSPPSSRLVVRTPSSSGAHPPWSGRTPTRACSSRGRDSWC